MPGPSKPATAWLGRSIALIGYVESVAGRFQKALELSKFQHRSYNRGSPVGV